MAGWGYCQNNGPAIWNQMFPIADGPRQSPIDIKQVAKDSSLNRLNPVYKDVVVSDISNTGSSWKAQIKGGYSSLKGGPLGNEYVLEQFHAHWGKTNHTGSEHTVDGKKYSAELHLVHWNKDKYGSFAEAAAASDGLAVLGMFLQIGNQENQELNKICRLLPFIQHKGQTIQVTDAIDPAKFIPRNGSFWTYDGSLTTPPLYESVTWLVYQEPLIVSEAQMIAMRMMKTYHPCETCPADDFGGQMVENYRPPCPLGARSVREYHETPMED